MISHTTERFRKLFDQLPKNIQKQARETYLQFENDPFILACVSNEFIPDGLFTWFAYQGIIGHWVSRGTVK